MRGLFITGTGTGVGKTVLAAAVCAALRARGERVAAFKPAVTGIDEPDPGGWPADDELLAAAAGMSAQAVTPLRFGPAVSPHLAAALAGVQIEPASLTAAARTAAAAADVLVAEGVGGLLVPLTLGYAVRDLARDLDLPLVVAAPPGLGTINHTLLTIEAARAVSLDVRGVVMGPWPDEPSAIEVSNRETVAQLGGVPVATMPRIEGLARPGLAGLAAAGAALPLDAWLAG